MSESNPPDATPEAATTEPPDGGGAPETVSGDGTEVYEPLEWPPPGDEYSEDDLLEEWRAEQPRTAVPLRGLLVALVAVLAIAVGMWATSGSNRQQAADQFSAATAAAVSDGNLAIKLCPGPKNTNTQLTACYTARYAMDKALVQALVDIHYPMDVQAAAARAIHALLRVVDGEKGMAQSATPSKDLTDYGAIQTAQADAATASQAVRAGLGLSSP